MLLKLNKNASIAAVQFKVRDLLISVMPQGHDEPINCPGKYSKDDCPHAHSLDDSCAQHESADPPPNCDDNSKEEILAKLGQGRHDLQQMRTKLHFDLQRVNEKIRDEILLPADPKMLKELASHLEYSLKVVKKHLG